MPAEQSFRGECHQREDEEKEEPTIDTTSVISPPKSSMIHPAPCRKGEKQGILNKQNR